MGRIPLEAPQLIGIARRKGSKLVALQRLDGIGKVLARVLGVIAREALQNDARIVHFRSDEALGERQRGAFVIGGAVLRAPQQHVARDGSLDPRQEPPARIQERERDALFGARLEHRRRTAQIPEHDDALQQVERQLHRLLAIHADDQRVVRLAQIGLGVRHVQRVEELLQNPASFQ